MDPPERFSPRERVTAAAGGCQVTGWRLPSYGERPAGPSGKWWTPAELRGLAGATPAEWKIAWKYVEPKFPLSADGRRNERLEVHRQAAIRELQARRRGAEKTNAQRWGNGRSAIAQRVVSES